VGERPLHEDAFTVVGDNFDHAGKASRSIKTILKQIGVSRDVIRKAVLVAYEAEINIVSYARQGVIHLCVATDHIMIEAIDEGQGIPDIELAMQPGWSTASQKVRDMGFGAGMGLCNIKSFADMFYISSEVGKGTHLKMIIKTKTTSAHKGKSESRQFGSQVTDISGKALGKMVESFMMLPGIGRKSAERLAFAILAMPHDDANGIAQAILNLKNTSRYCSICNNITEDDICSICRDEKRDSSRICVVEEPSNILILEKTGIFRGRYHAIMGAIAPLDGVGPENLKIDGLIERLKLGSIKEVIIATNPTVKGETTALYLSKLIKPLGISVSRIAYGLPVGGDIEYADENTVQRALEGRREM